MNPSQHRIACLEIHFAQFLAPLDEECGAHIKMELRESICPFRLCLSLVGSQYNLQIPAAENTHKISIPHSNGIFDADFPHEKTIHPPKSKLHELDAFRLQVGRKRSFRAEES